MRLIVSLLALLSLASCGADGEPEKPQFATTATIGVGSSGAHVGTYTTATSGKWTVGLGLGL